MLSLEAVFLFMFAMFISLCSYYAHFTLFNFVFNLYVMSMYLYMFIYRAVWLCLFLCFCCLKALRCACPLGLPAARPGEDPPEVAEEADVPGIPVEGGGHLLHPPVVVFVEEGAVEPGVAFGPQACRNVQRASLRRVGGSGQRAGRQLLGQVWVPGLQIR